MNCPNCGSESVAFLVADFCQCTACGETWRMTHAIPQPPPTEGQKIVVDCVIQDLHLRAEAGKKKYGTYLKTHNGRNALVDAYQEALDLAMYLKQAILEGEKYGPPGDL